MTRGNSIFLSRRASASTCPTPRASDRLAAGMFGTVFLGEVLVVFFLYLFSRKKGVKTGGYYFIHASDGQYFLVNKLYIDKKVLVLQPG